ncbi:MAG: glycosyltransferase family 2 protein [bacterium]|nr:glycosyltransferase family 2 protein [bacterium]
MECCILVLNYNGMAHLKDCLASLCDAIESCSVRCRGIVLDNCSSDESVGFIRNNFPEFTVDVAQRNDYLFSLNHEICNYHEEIIVFLNNDMRFDRGFIEPLIRHFSDPEVFAATAGIFDWDGKVITTGKRTYRLDKGWFYKDWDYKCQDACYTLDACGGAIAFRREMFLELGGFDTLYRPGYYEDLDLSYRAWKRGWKVVYEPRSIVYHKISASFGKEYGNASKDALLCRNHVLFMLKNVGNALFPVIFFIMLPYRMVANLLSGNKALAMGIIKAIPLMPQALCKRIGVCRPTRIKDREITAMIMTGKVGESG